jgi:GDP-4-dehydro-6-deoxy-D-mannose reductase
VFNIASGVPRRIGDILAAMLEMAGVEAAIEVDPGRLRRADIALAVGDASAARSVLGWSPAVAWETTLADILQDWRGRIGAG